MSRVLIFSLSFFLLNHANCQTTALYAFNNVAKEQQFNGLLKELRCLVCQNQDLNDSNAKLAVELKNLVYEKVNLSQSNAEIKSYLVERYGDFVTFSPPLSEKTYLLWGMPVVMIFFGLGLSFMIIRKAKPCS